MRRFRQEILNVIRVYFVNLTVVTSYSADSQYN